MVPRNTPISVVVHLSVAASGPPCRGLTLLGPRSLVLDTKYSEIGLLVPTTGLQVLKRIELFRYPARGILRNYATGLYDRGDHS